MKLTIREVLLQFTRLHSNGEHYECKHCHSVFSDMKSFPNFVKLQMMQTHLEDCNEFKKWNS